MSAFLLKLLPMVAAVAAALGAHSDWFEALAATAGLSAPAAHEVGWALSAGFAWLAHSPLAKYLPAPGPAK